MEPAPRDWTRYGNISEHRSRKSLAQVGERSSLSKSASRLMDSTKIHNFIASIPHTPTHQTKQIAGKGVEHATLYPRKVVVTIPTTLLATL